MYVFIVEVSAPPFLSPKNNPHMAELFQALPRITEGLKQLASPSWTVNVNVRFRPTGKDEINPPVLAIHVKVPPPFRLKSSHPQASPAERMNEALQDVLFPEGREGKQTRGYWQGVLRKENGAAYVWIEGGDQNAESKVYYHPIKVPSS